MLKINSIEKRKKEQSNNDVKITSIDNSIINFLKISILIPILIRFLMHLQLKTRKTRREGKYVTILLLE